MDQTVQALTAPMFLIVGLSHMVQPGLWANFFRVMRKTGVAPFIIAMYTLPLGLVLVVGHNKWVWDWPLFLTVGGWLMTLKAALYFLVPWACERMLERADRRPHRQFQIVGAVMAFFGGVLTWQTVMKTFPS